MRALNLTRDVLSGLSYLHGKRLLHRDLKPENIFLSDTDSAVIGDFGSVKKIPEGHTTVPGSGHSLAYRPPESVSTNTYGIQGDLYQVGIVLYQLLGGRLPYEATSWLNIRELNRYRGITDGTESQIFANDCIKRKIERGQVVDLGSLPPWVCMQFRRTISKAVAVDPLHRYQSCTEFFARLAAIHASIADWRVEEGYATLHQNKGAAYRIIPVLGSKQYRVEKKGGNNWRSDNSFGSSTVDKLVIEIEKKIR